MNLTKKDNLAKATKKVKTAKKITKRQQSSKESLILPKAPQGFNKILSLQGLWYFFVVMLIIAIFILLIYLFSIVENKINYKDFVNALLIGMFAQAIDGAIGMAYGLTASTFLISQGITPAIASGSIHIAEIFTTGASGLSHWRLKNVNSKLFLNLVFPGIIGGLIGVSILANIDGNLIKPWISLYLALMGIYIILKSIKKNLLIKLNNKKVTPLAFCGGLIDAVGGGGWGPIVTSTLVSRGHDPKKTIGSVNSAEFFITISTGISFALFLGISHPEIIAGLVLGGVTIAPFAAKITTKLPTKFLMLLVGLLIISLSAINLYKFFYR